MNLQDASVTRRRYQRLSLLYDFMEILPERFYYPWRQRLWSQVRGQNLLDAGVGTGKNMIFYPKGLNVTGVDLTPGMLKRARKRAANLKIDVDLQLGDVQALEFPDNYFDTVVATFVFCSVPDPVLGLREIHRIVKPNGQVLLLEHVRSCNAVLGKLMNLANSIVVRMTGANINRDTVENVRRSGLVIDHVENLGVGNIYKFIVAHA
ncbi:MAG: class I SAM-dependent methyltransferase [Anaerolineae bacterium]|nr:class I SAM-dependent methyltransferase [Anaerolineae bacterium]MDK1080776.1 class I SAM-dependent methyltransferase [Anaerolineae bacterium]MDK1117942.1 class I SAM-dependent methyltransferase [Anaerolineae bacterium]